MQTQKFSYSVSALSLAGFGLFGCAQNAPQAAAKNEAAKPVAATGHAGHAHEEAKDEHGGAAHAMEGGHTHTTKMLVSSQPAKVQAGQKAKWTLKIVDDIDSAPIGDFDTVHDKLLHLIVVSKDLSWFNHLHPEHKGGGVFEIETALPRAGSYKLYADYKPKERDGEVAQHAFSVGGANALPASPRLVADRLRGAWMTRTVASAPEEQPDKTGGAKYQVALMPMPAKIAAKQDVMLHFQVRDAAGKPVKLQPYLGAQGHLVLVSKDSNTYLHTHPQGGDHAGMDHGTMKHSAPSSGSDVMFHTQFPAVGLYKAWGQFRHNNRIITASFVLNVGAAKTGAAKTDAPKTSAPHDHNSASH